MRVISILTTSALVLSACMAPRQTSRPSSVATDDNRSAAPFRSEELAQVQLTTIADFARCLVDRYSDAAIALVIADQTPALVRQVQPVLAGAGLCAPASAIGANIVYITGAIAEALLRWDHVDLASLVGLVSDGPEDGCLIHRAGGAVAAMLGTEPGSQAFYQRYSDMADTAATCLSGNPSVLAAASFVRARLALDLYRISRAARP